MGFRGWLTRNATKVVNDTVEQSKQAIAENVGSRTELYYKLGRIGLLVVLMWLTGKETGGYLQRGGETKSLPSSPNHVTINNYIYKHERSDEE